MLPAAMTSGDTKTPKLIVGLGEILWDLFPSGKQLGGAPANFAYCASLLSDKGIAASRVGHDPLGDEALARLRNLHLETSFIQQDPDNATGTVRVSLDSHGEPSFVITENVAWDFLAWTPEWRELAQRADAVCFGSLAQRSPQSRETIRQFLAAVRPATLRIFDVNLRQSFYSAEILRDSLRAADIVKLNHEELPLVIDVLRSSSGQANASEQSLARHLLRAYGLKLVCVTRAAAGSILVGADDTNEHPGFPVKVADTVGSGDAFTAALAHHVLRGSTLPTINEAANCMGAWVASKAGATPALEPEILDRVRARDT
jgi:fructokinase